MITRLTIRTLLFCGALSLLAACRVELYADLDQRAANKMVAILMSEDIDAKREPGADGRYRILVDESAFGHAVDVLDQRGYPQQTFQTMGEVFEKTGLLSSPTEERARMLYALNQELAMTISEISGVISARIHVVLPERKPLSAEDGLASAAVFIRHRDDLDIQELVPHIKQLVSNSIPSLDYSSVSIVNVSEKSPVIDMTSEPISADVGGLGIWTAIAVGSIVVVVLSNAVWIAIWFRRRSAIVKLPPALVRTSKTTLAPPGGIT